MYSPVFCFHLCWGGTAETGAATLMTGDKHTAGPVAILCGLKHRLGDLPYQDCWEPARAAVNGAEKTPSFLFELKELILVLPGTQLCESIT